MSKILVLGPTGSVAESGHLRMQIWLRSLLEAGHEVSVLSRLPFDQPAPHDPENPFALDQQHYERLQHRRLVTDDEVQQAVADTFLTFAPDCVLAVSLQAACHLTYFSETIPLWVDLLPDLLTPNRMSEEHDIFDHWWNVGPLIDRADRITCAEIDDFAKLVAMIGWRGRLDQGDNVGKIAQVVWLPPDPRDPFILPEDLKVWWNTPVRSDLSLQAIQFREQWLSSHAAHLTHELDQIHRSKMWALWMASIRLRSFVGLPFVWLGACLAFLISGLSRAFSGLRLLLSTARRICASWIRRIFRSQALPVRTPNAEAPPRRPRLLIVMPYSIVPVNHGGARRLSNLIRVLSQDCDVHLLVFIQEEDDPVQRETLSPWVKKIYFHHWHPNFENSTGRLFPPSARLFYDERVSLQIRDIVIQEQIDVVQLEYTELAQYRDAVGDTPVILVEHDVAFRSFHRRRSLGFAERFPDSKAFGASFSDWMRLLRYEVEACREVDQLHMMSAADGSYLARFLPDSTRRMHVVPNAVDTEYYRPEENSFDRRSGVLMVGNYQNLPNLDAFEYLVEDIWPRVRQLRGDAELSVVGAKMPDKLLQWQGEEDGITIVGEVESIRAEYHRHRVLVVPLRAGSGTRLKLFEAFASGIPSVSTTIGAEGIDYVDDEHLLIADEADTIARAIVRLLDEPETAERLSQNALRLAEEKYDWTAAAQVNLHGVYDLMRPEPAPRVEAHPVANTDPQPFGRSPEGNIAISIVIPTYRGGELLERCLRGISRQQSDRPFEVLCIDSGSPEEDLQVMRTLGARVHGIDKKFFNHGLTRDLGAELARGEVLVYINQDVIAADEHWLQNLTAPLFAPDPPAAVQGAMAEFPHATSPVRRFFWDSCGERFYFTRESQRWISRYQGVGFSTVNAALRRDAWQQIPFGWAPFMEDKKWQRRAMEAGMQIVDAPEARVFHTHDYDVRSLARRCQSEGFGWRLLGERYTFRDMLADLWAPRQWKDLARGLWRGRREMKTAEIVFPWLRPVAVWYGNRRLQDVKH